MLSPGQPPRAPGRGCGKVLALHCVGTWGKECTKACLRANLEVLVARDPATKDGGGLSLHLHLALALAKENLKPPLKKQTKGVKHSQEKKNERSCLQLP